MPSSLQWPIWQKLYTLHVFPLVPVAARLRRRSAAARLLRLWVRIPPRAWTFVCCECCQVEVSATGWSLVQMSPTDCGASCVIYKHRDWGGTGPLGAAAPQTNKQTNKPTNTRFSSTAPSLFICMSNSRFRGPPHKYCGHVVPEYEVFRISEFFVIRSIRLSRRAPSLTFSQFCCT